MNLIDYTAFTNDALARDYDIEIGDSTDVTREEMIINLNKIK